MGEGSLELVPSEIEELLVPVPEKLAVSVKILDSLVREKKRCGSARNSR